MVNSFSEILGQQQNNPSFEKNEMLIESSSITKKFSIASFMEKSNPIFTEKREFEGQVKSIRQHL